MSEFIKDHEYHGLVFIGRFQPFHNGHLSVIKTAAKIAKRVLIVVGSGTCSSNLRNPFTFHERRVMIQTSLIKEGIHNFIIERQNDHPYDDERWIREIHNIVHSHFDFEHQKIGLIGHSKDETSYYMKLFPSFGSIDVMGVDHDGNILNATDIRNVFFDENNLKDVSFAENTFRKIKRMVPVPVTEFMAEYMKSRTYQDLIIEADYIKKYKKAWENAPFPPIFTTVDAVVYQAGYVLLVERGGHPGKGKLALPGGFLNEYERLETAVLRELKEETTIDIPLGVLKSKAVATKHFADPNRSSRGRTITFATLFNITSEIDRKNVKPGNPVGLTKVKGADDAKSAKWYPISSLSADMMHEDHFHIMEEMLKELK